jgi:hypothetical protein
MTTEEFIIDLFCRVDTAMHTVPNHAQANLYPSELVTLALLFALKGVGPRVLSVARARLPSLVPEGAAPHPLVPPVCHASYLG